ncbi:MAG: Asp23/Gls24 family envelope stress response protein [Oscillospiraceae bacterium]|nr:Asp23/Gls24 family envelope stress response protein [Oscillospiraceae bacterium]
MADTKEYLVQPLENGSIQISADVIASIAAFAVREIEGVYGLSLTQSFDISAILGKKNLRKGIHVILKGEEMEISCNLIVHMGYAVMEVARKVQDAIASEVEDMTGKRPDRVNVNVCAVAVPKTK